MGPRIASVQAKFIHFEGAHDSWLKLIHSRPQPTEGHGRFEARQGKVGRKRPILYRYAKASKPLLRVLRKLCQTRAGMNAAPKHLGSTLVWEPAKAADLKRERVARRYFRKRGFQLIHAIGRPLANKLRGDVEVIERAPLDQRLGAQRIQQPIHASQDFLGQIDSGE